MRNSLLLIVLGTTVAFGTSSPLRAQAPPAATRPNPTNEYGRAGILDSPVVFEWKSGYLSSFVDHIKEIFGIDLNQRADIPGEMRYTRVPSMKIKTALAYPVVAASPNVLGSDFGEVRGTAYLLVRRRFASGPEAEQRLERSHR